MIRRTDGQWSLPEFILQDHQGVVKSSARSRFDLAFRFLRACGYHFVIVKPSSRLARPRFTFSGTRRLCQAAEAWTRRSLFVRHPIGDQWQKANAKRSVQTQPRKIPALGQGPRPAALGKVTFNAFRATTTAPTIQTDGSTSRFSGFIHFSAGQILDSLRTSEG